MYYVHGRRTRPRARSRRSSCHVDACGSEEIVGYVAADVCVGVVPLHSRMQIPGLADPLLLEDASRVSIALDGILVAADPVPLRAPLPLCLFSHR